jgi:hypothetical protein
MGDEWIDGGGLIRVAADHRYELTPRSLELWRYRGLLPRPQRQPKGRAVWLYPPGTDRQLLRLLYWRERARTLDAVRVALWVEGFPIKLDSVRQALGSLVDTASSTFQRELGSPKDRSATIEVLAKKLASMRGRAPYPRVVRMRSDERARAYGYMLALASGDQIELERRKEDAQLLERMIGLRSGHNDGLAHLSPLNTKIGRLLPHLSAEYIRAVVASAGEEEYELVRLLVRTLLLWLPMLLPLMRSSTGSKGIAIFDAAQELFRDAPAEVHEVITIGMLVSLQVKAPEPGAIRDLLAGMSLGTIDAEMLTLIPTETRNEAFKRMRPDQRVHLKDELARHSTRSH